LGLAWNRAGNHARSLAVLDPLCEALFQEGSPDALAVRSNYAAVLVDAGRYAEARTIYEEVATRSEDDETRHLARFGAGIAIRRAGFEPEGRAGLLALFDEMKGAGALRTKVGVRVVDELLAILLPAKDPHAIFVQRALLDATIREVGPDEPGA